MANDNSPWGRKPGGGNSGGNSGSGGSGGGKPPGAGGPNPFEKIIRDSQEKMREALKKGGGDNGDHFNEKKIIALVLSALLLLWGASGIYRVNSDELGVVLRFGQYNRTTTSGLNYHLPSPIEKVIIPSVTTVNKVEIGSRAGGADNPNVRVAKYSSLADASLREGVGQSTEGLMLTGDRKLVDIDFAVLWKIDAAAPEKFLFNMRNPAGNVKYVAESAMREVIGRNILDDVLRKKQGQISQDALKLIQQTFNEYDAGIEIVAVNLSRPDVPLPVIEEYQDVKRAEQDKQTAESVAEGYRNEIIPRAKGDAAKMIQDSEAYKSKVIADATGNASRFKQIYAEYAQAKEVTKRRMYLETMEEVLKGMPKIIMEKGGQVSVLPLTMPTPKAASAAAATTTVTPVPAQ